jgi:endonuclease/exonuclease/phosphatase family metal-dependent hydrolase
VRSLVAIALAGCVSVGDEGGPWEPAGSITGELAPELGPAIAKAAPPSRLRVATWNVHYSEDPADLAMQIRRSTEISRADVLLVQETEAHLGEAGSRAQQLAGALGMTWVYAPARTLDDGDGTHGIAILSRLPIESPLVKRLPFIEQPYHARPRNALAVDVAVGDTVVHLVNVHLDVRINAADRIRQLDPAANDQIDPVVLGGDFNSNPWAWVQALVPLTGTEAIVGQDQAAIVDDYMGENAWTGALPSDTATMRVPFYDIRIDNLYARGLAIEAVGVEHVDGSDHWPVWFDVVP